MVIGVMQKTAGTEAEGRRKKKGNQEALHHILSKELTLAGVRQEGGLPRVVEDT